MTRSKLFSQLLFAAVIVISLSGVTMAQRVLTSRADTAEFGPVMQAYLGYLRNEQEVVDDRVSRREVNASYYRRNSSRIRALREMAIRLVTRSGNDYVPELEAVTTDEFTTLFENPPNPRTFRVNQVLTNTFRYLGTVNTGEVFYIFARLDPYEQAALIEGQNSQSGNPQDENATAKSQRIGQTSTRPRRTGPK
ncbi:MAG TPA: hypothetical protein VJT71_20690 [Pyrinomonadaceae bacterium]|nr:hypothetical protein [Pyrinomonadaceae bacterium]